MPQPDENVQPSALRRGLPEWLVLVMAYMLLQRPIFVCCCSGLYAVAMSNIRMLLQWLICRCNGQYSYVVAMAYMPMQWLTCWCNGSHAVAVVNIHMLLRWLICCCNGRSAMPTKVSVPRRGSLRAAEKSSRGFAGRCACGHNYIGP